MSGVKILIAAPSYAGEVCIEFMQSVMTLTAQFNKVGIGWDIVMVRSTLLHVTRSVMATKALVEGFSHLLFIDTDMSFAISAVSKLLEAETEVIGCAYPYRTIPLHTTVTANGQTLRELISQSVPYAAYLPEGATTVDMRNGICEVQALGTGLMLVRTTALQTMIDKGVVDSYRVGFPNNQWLDHPVYYGFFDHKLENDTYLGEDISFCRRWREECGQKIFAVCDEEIMHIGPMPVIGRFRDKLATGKL